MGVFGRFYRIVGKNAIKAKRQAAKFWFLPVISLNWKKTPKFIIATVNNGIKMFAIVVAGNL